MSVRFDTVAPGASGSNSAPARPAPRSVPVAEGDRSDSGAPVQPLSGRLQQVANEINEFLKANASDLKFLVDPASNRLVVRVVDSQTGDVIRQIPSQEMLDLSHALARITGLLLNQKA